MSNTVLCFYRMACVAVVVVHTESAGVGKRVGHSGVEAGHTGMEVGQTGVARAVHA